MKGFKKFLTVLIAAIMCLELIPGIALANEPTYTWYAVSRNNITFLNTQDGKTMTEFNYNNVVSSNSGANWGYYGGYTKEKFLAMYLKFDLSELKGKNIKDAAVYAGFSGNGTAFRMYGIPNNDWNDTTAPVIDRSAENLIASVTKMSPSITVTGFGERNAEFACGELVKKALENGDDYICFELECTNGGAYSTIWGKASTSPSYPKLAYKVSSNSIPVVEVSADKESYAPGETVTVTASSTDADGDAVTYSFKVDGVENTDNVSGNVLTIDTLTGGTHTIDVIGTDEYGDSSSASVNVVIKKVAEITKGALPRNKAVYLNTQDGKTMAEFSYNNVNAGNNGANWGYYAAASTNAKFLAMYVKFDLSDYSDANIVNAKVYAGASGSSTKFRMYRIPNSDWDDERAPVVDRSASNQVGETVTKLSPSITETGYGERNLEFPCLDEIKKAIANGDKYICFEFESAETSGAYSSVWGKALTSTNYPKLYLETSSNKVPVVTATTDKDKYTDTENIVVTASATDPDGDDITYSFKVDGVLDTEHALGNVLTLPPLSSGEHEIDVICTDEYGDYNIYNIVLNITGAPVKTINTLANSGIFNSYDEKTVAEYNNDNQFSQPYNYVLSGDSAKRMQLYVKYDISAYKDADISAASLFWWIQGSNHCGKTLKVYGLDADSWNTTIAPKVDRANNTLVTHVVPSTTLVNYTADDPLYSYASGYNTIFGDTQSSAPDYGITDYIKNQLAKGKTTVCFVIERTSGGYSTASKSSSPKLAIQTTTNKVPQVTLTSNKDGYKSGDDVIVIANATDADEDATLTYKFFINGVEADSSKVTDNVLNVGKFAGEDINVSVKCFDEYGDYGVDSIVIVSGDAYTAIGTFTGTIASGNTLTAEGSITNKTAESVSVQIIIAVYDADGNLYDAQFTTMTIPANDSDVYGVDYELPSKDLTDYTAKAFIWESTTQTPLAPAFDLEANN